jgi:hypothetical protein
MMKSYGEDPSAYRHKAVLVEYEGRSEWIDEALAGLIKKAWQLGINTNNCCQEVDPGISHIMFLTGLDGERFCRMLIDIDLDWAIFEDLDKTRKDFGLSGYERGYFPFEIPVWSRGYNHLMFPLAYAEQFEESLSKPELQEQGPKTIFVSPAKTHLYWR